MTESRRSTALRARSRHLPAVAAAVGARLWAYLWPERVPRRNRTYLRDRLIALPVLAVVAFTSFGWAYAQVRSDTDYLRGRVAPALVGLADAKTSLQIAHHEAEDSLADGQAARLSGLSDEYGLRMTRSAQQLDQVARSGALTPPEQQKLSVTRALVEKYGSYISRAEGDADDPALRTAELSYSRTILCTHLRPNDLTKQCRADRGYRATTVVDQISALEQALHGRLAERAAWGDGVLAAAGGSLVAFALLVFGLWRTLSFLHRRFRVRPSLPLLLAALPLAAVPLLTVDAVLAQHAQHTVVGDARTLSEETTPQIEISAEDDAPGDVDRHSIERLGGGIDHELAAGRVPGVPGAAPYVVPVGLLSAAVTGAALHMYRREYLLVTRPGAVT
ncbi:hypothetical protein ACWCP6_07385 [Streptomyces sp. NPDC002004]